MVAAAVTFSLLVRCSLIKNNYKQKKIKRKKERRWRLYSCYCMQRCGLDFPHQLDESVAVERRRRRSLSFPSSSSVLLLTFVLNMFLSFIRNRRFLQPVAASQVRPSICPPVVVSSLLLIRTFRRNPSTSPLTVPHLSMLSASSLVESW